jgi:hypothetical protein
VHSSKRSLSTPTPQQKRDETSRVIAVDAKHGKTASPGLGPSAAIDDGMPPRKKQKLDAAAESPDGDDARKRKRQAIEADGEGEPPGEERTKGRSIDVGLSGLALLIRHPRAADLLISMAAAAVRCYDGGRRELLLPTIPPEFYTRAA